MTTMAYDGRYIAIDSRITCGSWISTDDFDKTVETDEWVVFWTGDLDKKEDFILAFLNNGKVNEPAKTSLFAFNKKSEKLFDVFSQECVILKSPITFKDSRGSGSSHAITAMDFGAGAIDAVKAAMKRCNCTGGTIRCFDTKTKKFIQVKQ